MSNDSAEKHQAFQHWVSSLRPKAAARENIDEESGVTSLDDQATLVRQLPKDVVRLLREREAGRHFAVDPDSTAIFTPPPDLIARSRRLTPPKKPERGLSPSAPPEQPSQSHPTPVVAPPSPAEAVAVAEIGEQPLPVLADAVELDEPQPVIPTEREPNLALPITVAYPAQRGWRFGWTAVAIGSALAAASAWFALTH
jgi:hypothetical protein